MGTINRPLQTAQTAQIVVPGFPVELENILGAGDAFASGFLYGFVNGWDWYKAARLGNACGAILGTKHGCANFMPTSDEVMLFIQNHGCWLGAFNDLKLKKRPMRRGLFIVPTADLSAPANPMVCPY